MGSFSLRDKVNWFDKFVDTARNDLTQLQGNLILPIDGGYSVFGVYTLTLDNSDVIVTKSTKFIDRFTSKKTALSWCIADKYNQQKLALQIELLDFKFRVAEQAVRTRELALAQANANKDVILAKLAHRKQQKFYAQAELEKCVKQAKYLQIRGFANDTQRNSRTKT